MSEGAEPWPRSLAVFQFSFSVSVSLLLFFNIQLLILFVRLLFFPISFCHK